MAETYHVLNVEDNPNTARLIRLVLSELPLEVHHASDGKQALEMIKTLKPNLIILDIGLTDMHGWEVLDQMTAKGLDPKVVPVIILTSHTEASHRVIAKLKSVASYMTKPFEPDELAGKVKELLKIG